ncbi:hypothetical protein ACJ41O_008635 [Fusarium nematophilum]
MRLENGEYNPFRRGVRHSPRYFDDLRARRQNLPVCSPEARQEFLDRYHSGQVTILIGDTGCGKTTQLSQFILFDEFNSGKMVACTQPRRIAATSVAQRVAREMEVPLGRTVRYAVRFDIKTTLPSENNSEQTRLKFVTDGRLLRELENDPLLHNYSCIIIDEAYEQTTNTGTLLSLLKHIMQRRTDLKIVVMSATLNLDKFTAFFGTSNVFRARSLAYNLEVQYLAQATPNYKSCAVRVVDHILQTKPRGDILLFMTNVREIDETCAMIRRRVPRLTVLPLSSGLPRDAKDEALTRLDTQKCVVCTNVAESSLAIPGIVYVIGASSNDDPPYKPHLSSLRPPASWPSWTNPERRLLPPVHKETHDNVFLANTPPGILTNELSEEVLRLKKLNFAAVARFNFIDPPHPEVYLRALQDLRAMDYIDARAMITTKGKQAASLPIHPAWYNSFLEARKLGCLGEIIGIAALLSTQDDIFMRPHPVRYAADVIRQQFDHPASDHLARLNAIHLYIHQCLRYDNQDARGRQELEDWCNRSFINHRVAEEARSIQNQLLDAVSTQMLHGGPVPALSSNDKDFNVKIRRALAAGFYYKAAIRADGQDIYKTVHDNHPVGIEPDSCLIGMPWEWVICHNIHYAGVQYMQVVTAVDPAWLIDLDYFQDHNLGRKYAGELKNPAVKASLARARAKRELALRYA